MNKSKALVGAAGGTAAVAKKLGISGQTVRNYVKRDSIPEKHLASVCELTGGLITPAMARPDLAELFGKK